MLCSLSSSFSLSNFLVQMTVFTIRFFAVIWTICSIVLEAQCSETESSKGQQLKLVAIRIRSGVEVKRRVARKKQEKARVFFLFFLFSLLLSVIWFYKICLKFAGWFNNSLISLTFFWLLSNYSSFFYNVNVWKNWIAYNQLLYRDQI